MPSSTRLCTVFLLVLLSGTATRLQAQDEPATSLRKGAWALQFGVGGNFSPTSFNDADISVKHHHADNSAMRFGLAVNSTTRNIDPEEGAGSSAYEAEGGVQNLLLRADYLRYPFVSKSPFDAIQLYWGAGPVLRFYRNRQELDANDYLSSTRRWGGGAEALVGVEWFVKPRISLMVEYGASVEYDRVYIRSRRDLNDAPLEDQKSSGYQLDARTNGVRFGISVYVNPGK